MQKNRAYSMYVNNNTIKLQANNKKPQENMAYSRKEKKKWQTFQRNKGIRHTRQRIQHKLS